MIYCREFMGQNLDGVLREVSEQIGDNNIINIQHKEKKNQCEGYDEYDTWVEEYHYVKVFYKG